MNLFSMDQETQVGLSLLRMLSKIFDSSINTKIIPEVVHYSQNYF